MGYRPVTVVTRVKCLPLYSYRDPGLLHGGPPVEGGTLPRTSTPLTTVRVGWVGRAGDLLGECHFRYRLHICLMVSLFRLSKKCFNHWPNRGARPLSRLVSPVVTPILRRIGAEGPLSQVES